MSNQELIELLTQKAQQKQLAAFYIVENHPHLPAEKLYQWMAQLLGRLLQLDSRPTAKTLWEIPDVDTILIHTQAERYNVDQITSALQQLHYQNFTQKHRYLIISEAHKCTPIISNKLLKTLEEPPLGTTIFLLDLKQSPLLPTVRSRGLTLRLTLPSDCPRPQATTAKEFSHYLQAEFPQLARLWDRGLPLGELAKAIQQAGQQDCLIQAAINWHQAHVQHFEQCTDLLQLLQFVQQQKVFHGRIQTQLALIIPKLTIMPRSLTSSVK